MKNTKPIAGSFATEWIHQFTDHCYLQGLTNEEIETSLHTWGTLVAKYANWLATEGMKGIQIDRAVNQAINLAEFDIKRLPIVP